jgi:hypothetical protein
MGFFSPETGGEMGRKRETESSGGVVEWHNSPEQGNGGDAWLNFAQIK